MNREEAIERIKQNKAAAEFHAGMVQNTNAIENELKDIEAMEMAIEALSTEAEQVTGKLNSPCEPLLKSDSDECKEQKSKLDLISRQALCHYALNQKDKSVTPNDIMRFPSAETPTVSEKHQLSEETPTNTSTDLISRQDALKPFCVTPDGSRIPEVDCDNFPVEFSAEFIKKHLLSLPSAEPCDKDAISREGLLKSWEELSPRGRTEFDQVIMTIPALPSAEPKTGKWVRVIDSITLNEVKWHYECDQCGAGRCEIRQRYCSNCGKRMLGEDGE